MTTTRDKTKRHDWSGLELEVDRLVIGGVPSNAGLIKITGAYTFLAENSGKTHVISAISGDAALVLPSVDDGLEYVIFMGGIVAETDDWDFVNADAAPFLGGLLWLDANAGSGGDEVVPVLPDGTDDTMAIVNVGVGTRLHLISDGTSWFVNGLVVSDDTPTFSTAA